MPAKQIYLDSSDISSLSDNSRVQDHSDLQETWQFLLSQINQGTIAVRYSFVHITEISQLDHRYLDAALRRAATLNKLCNGQVLLAPDHLLRSELRIALGLDGNTFPNYAYGTDDQWIPDIENQIASIRQSAIQTLHEILKSLPRAQRRPLEKLLFAGNGLSERGIRELTKANSSLIPAFEAEFPLTEKFWKEDMLSLYLMGKITDKQLAKELKKGFANPENFIGWIVDRHDANLKVPGWLRSQGDNYIRFIAQLRDNVEVFQRAALATGRSERDIQSELSMVLGTSDIRTKILQREVEKLSAEARIEPDGFDVGELASVPMLDCLLNAARLHAIANMKGRHRKPRVSDMGDILHCMYIPHVDVFRTDSYGASVFRPLGEIYGTKIVGRLKQLPEVIEALL